MIAKAGAGVGVGVGAGVVVGVGVIGKKRELVGKWLATRTPAPCVGFLILNEIPSKTILKLIF